MLFVAIGLGFLLAAAALRFTPDLLVVPRSEVVAASAVVAAIGAALADGAATGVEPLDLVLRAALGALFVLGGAVVGRFAPLIAALVCAFVLLDATSPVVALAGLALGVAMVGAVAGGRLPLTGAVTGGLLAQVVLRLDWPLFTGASLLAGALVSLVLLVPAIPRIPSRAARPVGLAVGGVIVVGIIGGVAGLVAAAGVATDVDAAVDSAQRGLDLLGDDADAAEQALLVAADHFRAAEERLDAPWALPARAVPFLAQQVRAVETMASAGGNLARVAAESVDEADIDGIRPVDGRVDLAALVALQEPLRRADDALAAARERLEEVDSPWLVGPVADRRAELLERVDGAAGSAEVAAQAVVTLPAMLGGDGTRRYLLLMQQPAEARGSGGLPGNWGEIVAEDGQLELVRFGRLTELIDGGIPEGRRTIDMPASFDELYGYDPILLKWQNVTWAPDFPTAAELARQLYPQSGGSEVDGVLSVDPTAIAALLGVVGPVDLPGDRQLTEANAERLLYFEQYLELDAAQDANALRIDLLGAAAEETWARLTSGALPGPSALADALGGAVAGRHLQLVAFDDEANDLLERVGMTGALEAPEGDGAGVFVENFGQNKIDWFLRHDATYEAQWDPASGEAVGTYRITLDNAAPVAGLPDAIIGWGGVAGAPLRPETGENLAGLYIHTALPPTEVRVDGEQRTGRAVLDHGWYVTQVLVRVPPGGTLQVELQVAGALPGRDWSFTAPHQPAVTSGRLDVALEVVGAWELDALHGLERSTTGSVSASIDLDAPGAVGLEVRRPPDLGDSLLR